MNNNHNHNSETNVKPAGGKSPSKDRGVWSGRRDLGVSTPPGGALRGPLERGQQDRELHPPGPAPPTVGQLGWCS